MENLNNLSLIAAIGKNRELGLDNKLIWRIKEDLEFYKMMTMGKNIVMGRKTFESMPASALRGRNPFVISSKPLDQIYDINCFNSIESMLEYVKMYNEEQFMVVGGAQIYEAFMPYVNAMYLTQIQEYAPADTYFPKFDIKDWDISMIANEWQEKVPYMIKQYVRKR